MSKQPLLIDVEENPKKLREWLLFALQHILAMLVACITVPMLTGLPIAPTIISAGVGTLIYALFTRRKSPIFQASSFAFIAAINGALLTPYLQQGNKDNYLAVIIGMLFVGLSYVSVAIIIHFSGTRWIDKVLPPVIVGPVIMVIGLGLSGSAIANMTSVPMTLLEQSDPLWTLAPTSAPMNYNWCSLVSALTALFATALALHYGKKMIRLIPFIIGMLAGYGMALLFTVFGYYIGGNSYFHVIDFQPLIDIFGPGNVSLASFFNWKLFLPNDEQSFIFLRFEQIAAFDWSRIGSLFLLFVPLSFVTMCEHIGDHENIGNILGRDLLHKQPGMTRTLLGDGVGTMVGGVLSGTASTTYGENVAVIGLSRIASANVIILAAVLSILFGFLTPFTALLQTIPPAVTGGVSLILYGYIAFSGIRLLLERKIDFGNSKNVFIVSVILVSGIGGLCFKIGDPDRPFIEMTSIAVAMLLGILLNLILIDPKKRKRRLHQRRKKEMSDALDDTTSDALVTDVKGGAASKDESPSLPLLPKEDQAGGT